MSDRDRPIRKDTGLGLTLQHVARCGGKLVQLVSLVHLVHLAFLVYAPR